MSSRRKFLRQGALTSLSVFAGNTFAQTTSGISGKSITSTNTIVLSTWKFGVEANRAAWKVLENKGTALDAVEAGIKIPEGDPKERSVGYGGRPDRDGRVTLDACIMDHEANIGAVACLENIKHPISVARAVMEKTPHVLLVADGALAFALDNGFTKENLLVDKSEKEWKEWLKKSNYMPKVNIENHDTIGMIALDSYGNLSGGCSTSGMAYKMHGRVGDSPLIGAGLYVDNEIGAATATGHGEEVIRIAGCHLVVELMRQGLDPHNACKEATNRVIKLARNRNKNLKDIQVGFIAINKKGEYGAFCLQKGFNYAVHNLSGSRLLDADFHLEFNTNE